MSTVDPSAVKPYRVVAAVSVYVLAVVNAGVCGWGWQFGRYSEDQLEPHVGAFVVGTVIMAPLILGAAFLTPLEYRTGKQAGPRFTIALGGLALAMAVGMVIGAGGPTPSAGIVLAVGVVVTTVAVLSRQRARRRADTYSAIKRTGRKIAGVVTDATQTSTVNGCPRWRVVIKFVDHAGTDWWVTRHVTTWSPPSKQERVTVRYDPAQPGAKKRIFVDELDSRERTELH